MLGITTLGFIRAARVPKQPRIGLRFGSRPKTAERCLRTHFDTCLPSWCSKRRDSGVAPPANGDGRRVSKAAAALPPSLTFGRLSNPGPPGLRHPLHLMSRLALCLKLFFPANSHLAAET